MITNPDIEVVLDTMLRQIRNKEVNVQDFSISNNEMFYSMSITLKQIEQKKGFFD